MPKQATLQEVGSIKKLVVLTLLITPSGALSPGPLSASGIIAGVKLGVIGGLAIGLGHMIFELPYIALLVLFLSRVRHILSKIEKPLAIFVTVFLVYFGVGVLLDAYNIHATKTIYFSNGLISIDNLGEALLVGIVLTGANPYFLAWWIGVGLPLLKGSAEHGSLGFGAMYASHVWMDFVWLAALAFLGYNVSKMLSAYAIFLGILGVILIVFGIDILLRLFGKKLIPI